jgi:hypothetical protein
LERHNILITGETRRGNTLKSERRILKVANMQEVKKTTGAGKEQESSINLHKLISQIQHLYTPRNSHH